MDAHLNMLELPHKNCKAANKRILYEVNIFEINVKIEVLRENKL